MTDHLIHSSDQRLRPSWPLLKLCLVILVPCLIEKSLGIGLILKIRQNVVIKASELKAKKIRTGRGNGHTLHINTYEGRSLRQKS